MQPTPRNFAKKPLTMLKFSTNILHFNKLVRLLLGNLLEWLNRKSPSHMSSNPKIRYDIIPYLCANTTIA